MDAVYPWPLEEALARPALTLALAFLVPIATGRALALALLPRSPAADDPDARAARVAPFRAATFWTGLVQIQLAYAAGHTALGPALVEREGSGWCDAFGALAALLAFLGGGVARLVERDGSAPAVRARDAIAVRLRLAAYFAGPLAAVGVAQRLPFVTERGIDGGWLALAAALVVVGILYGGLASAVLTTALRRPSERVRALAVRAAAREGVRLASVWRLPTGSFPFANAAAIPWARTMIVTDRLTEILDDEELDAVLAHEAGHLSEAPWVGLARVGAAAVLMVALALGPSLARALGLSDDAQLGALAALAAVAIGLVVLVRDLARRMEVRADSHARAHVGPAALARALRKLHDDALAPSTTGKKRVHPDLHDRLAACGEAPPVRAEPPRTRAAALAGLALGAALAVLAWLAHELTALPAREAELASEAEAWRRLRVDPWDGSATLSLAWSARRREDLERAEAYATEALRLGVPAPQVLELEAELLAARGECARARETFERALAARVVDPLAASLELGGYRIPPTVLTECDLGRGVVWGPGWDEED
jgi:Zn-dependent protease with chaperone function